MKGKIFLVLFLFFKHSNGKYYLIETGEKWEKKISKGCCVSDTKDMTNSKTDYRVSYPSDNQELSNERGDYNSEQLNYQIKTLKEILQESEKNPGKDFEMVKQG